MITLSKPWTIHDLDTLPDDGGWHRYEIINGDFYMTCAPHFRHQQVSLKLSMRLEAWSETTGLGSTNAIPGVIFTETDAVIPDVVWISSDRLTTALDESVHLIIALELVVGILSPGAENEQWDKEIKRKLYSQHGVQEY